MVSHRPSFIVIGAPKAGTTALYRYLRNHPEVYMTPIKETNFFRYRPGQLRDGIPDDLVKGTIRSLDAYLALFHGMTDERAAGEASPQYFHSPVAAANIKKHLPEVQIIAILRHPVDRAYSHYMMHMNAGRVPYQAFETFFEAAVPRLEAWSQMPYDCYGLARSFYYPSLKRYYDLFPRKQIRIYRSEDLKSHLGSLLADLYRFIGVDDTLLPDRLKEHNVGGGIPKNQPLHRLITGENRLKAYAKRLLPKAWRHQAQQTLLQRTRTPKTPLPPHVRDVFFDVYREDVRRTQQLTGVDLSRWFPNTPAEKRE